MKSKMLPLIIVCLFQANSSFAAEGSFDKHQFLREGLSRTQESLEDIAKDLTPANDRTCPDAGTVVLENLSQEKGKVFSIADRIDDVRDAVKPQRDQLQSDRSRCGSCQQNNVVSLYTSISPEKHQYSAQCENRPTETLNVNVKDKSEVKGFIEAVLTGKNAEGKRLHKSCPDPCSFYITSAETEAHGRKQVTLTVQCGQPRNGSIFSAKYDYKSGLVHQWTCSK